MKKTVKKSPEIYAVIADAAPKTTGMGFGGMDRVIEAENAASEPMCVLHERPLGGGPCMTCGALDAKADKP